MKFRTIGIYDTAVNSLNLGDQIILDAVKKELKELYPTMVQFTTIPTHERISRRSHRISNNNKLNYISGTNLLNSKFKILKANQWNINLIDVLYLQKNIVLMGVGWSNYQKDSTWLTNFVYNKLFKNNFVHSVRDEYTLKKLEKMGVTNVINTGCPTTWKLTKEFCSEIETNKQDIVVTTLTDYREDIENDTRMLDILTKNYSKVYLWLQGTGDFNYFNKLNIAEKEKIQFISPSLESFDDFLMNNKCDYIGTRLHAGIRALQNKRRSIIISVDNRASEMGKDLNLPVVDRTVLAENLEKKLKNDFKISITIPEDRILEWKRLNKEKSNG